MRENHAICVRVGNPAEQFVSKRQQELLHVKHAAKFTETSKGVFKGGGVQGVETPPPRNF